jgi:hypothetical protein
MIELNDGDFKIVIEDDGKQYEKIYQSKDYKREKESR